MKKRGYIEKKYKSLIILNITLIILILTISGFFFYKNLKEKNQVTGYAVSNLQNPGSLPFLNVKDFGAVGDGNADDTQAIQNAIDSMTDGGKLFFPIGTYKITDTIYLNNPDWIENYILEGAGYGTILKPVNNKPDFFMFKINENKDGIRRAEWPNHPRLIAQNFRVEGDQSLNASLFWYNRASVQMKNLYLNYLLYGLTGRGYTDQVSIENINWHYVREGGWLYKQGDSGDGFYAKQIFADGDDVIFLHSTIGGVIEDVIGGRYTFYNVLNVVVRDSHFENTIGGPTFRVAGGKVTFENNFIFSAGGVEPISISEDASYRRNVDVTLKDNVFASQFSGSLSRGVSIKEKTADISIGNFGAQSNLHLENNKNYVYRADALRFEKFGIRAIALYNAQLNDALKNNMAFISGNVNLILKNNKWGIYGQTLDGRIIIDEGKTFPSSTDITPNIAYIGKDDIDELGFESRGNYCYKSAIIDTPSETPIFQSNEKCLTINEGDSIALRITGGDFSNKILKIWRKKDSGNYNKAVLIPTVVNDVELSDYGDYISGFKWEAA